MAGTAERPYELSVVAIEDPHHVVGAIRNQDIFLLRVGGKREVIHRAARWIGHAPDSAAVRAARLRGRVDPKLLYEFALLGEHLNAVAAALAYINKTVARGMCAVQRGGEIFLIGRRAGYSIRRGVA